MTICVNYFAEAQLPDNSKNLTKNNYFQLCLTWRGFAAQLPTSPMRAHASVLGGSLQALFQRRISFQISGSCVNRSSFQFPLSSIQASQKFQMRSLSSAGHSRNVTGEVEFVIHDHHPHGHQPSGTHKGNDEVGTRNGHF